MDSYKKVIFNSVLCLNLNVLLEHMVSYEFAVSLSTSQKRLHRCQFCVRLAQLRSLCTLPCKLSKAPPHPLCQSSVKLMFQQAVHLSRLCASLTQLVSTMNLSLSVSFVSLMPDKS